MKLNRLFSQLKRKNKNVKFPKAEKVNVQIKPRKISQKGANILLLSFILGIVGLASLTIVSNAFRSFRQEKPVIQTKGRDSRNLSNRVGLFMTDFLNSYFIEDKDKKRLVNVVQVTFADGLGLTRQENFTLTLQVDQDETYRVGKLNHGILKKYEAELK